MNNEEQQNNDERFYLEELKFGCFAICDHENPYAKKAAEAERDRLNAWNREGGNIRPVEYLPKPRRVPTVFGRFSEPPPHTLTVAEKRRYLAEIFRSPDSTDADKFKALQEDNKMQAMFSRWNGKEQSHD